MARSQRIARSIVYAILNGNQAKIHSLLSQLIAAIAAFFALYQLSFIRFKNNLFEQLRDKWQIDEHGYKDSFAQQGGLKAKGDMGFSGSVSTFSEPDTCVDKTG